jgi:phosphatidylglycerol lysyltransferase
MNADLPDDRVRAQALAEEHGWNATAFQTLAAPFQYFFHGAGYVAYVDTGSSWVAAGAPVCASEDLLTTTVAFGLAAKAANKRWLFFGAEGRLLEATGTVLSSILIGEQPVWDPRTWSASLSGHRSLREQLRRAKSKGVVVRQTTEGDKEALADELARLVERWLMTRSMPAMGFLVAVRSAFQSARASHFVARHQGRIVAVASVIPVPQRNGVFIEHLLRDPTAPNGTIELLVDAVCSWAALERASWLTLGLAPLAGPVAGPLRFARRRLRWLYDFEGLARFKAKLRPSEWLPIYLAFPSAQGALPSTLDALRAFASDGFLRFALGFVSLGHPLVLALLALLLLPWTALLASSSDVWFGGHSAVKWAWVLFDSLVAVGIFWLLRRPSWRLARALAVAVSFDAFLTPVEAALWNLPHIRSGLEVLVVLTASVAPVLGATALWGAAGRLERLHSPS